MNLARRTGLRLAPEFVVIVAAAAVAGVLRAGPWGIGAAVFLVWLIAAVVEHSLARQPAGGKRRAAKTPRKEPLAEEAAEPLAAPPAANRVRIVAPAAAAKPEPEP